jgi:AAA family ATP:ADP antiporter
VWVGIFSLTTIAQFWSYANEKAKQAIDTFFVRAGDMLAAGVAFVGTHLVHRGVPGFARLNMVFVFLAMWVAWLLLREYRRLASERVS